MTTIADLVHEYFPDESAEECDFIVLAKTGFPSFWNFREGETTPEQVFRRQLAEERDRRAAGRTGCYRCGEAFEPTTEEREICPACLRSCRLASGKDES